jgi:hypothetical protein
MFEEESGEESGQYWPKDSGRGVLNYAKGC